MDSIVDDGDPNAIVEGLIIQELNSDHEVVFEWKSWDHFNITDNTYLDLTSNSFLRAIISISFCKMSLSKASNSSGLL